MDKKEAPTFKAGGINDTKTGVRASIINLLKQVSKVNSINEESFANNVRNFMANVNRKSSRQKNMTAEGKAIEPEWN